MSNKTSEIEEDNIVELYATGLSCHSIAKITGRSDRTVWRILKDRNVKLRPARRQVDISNYVGLTYGKWTVLSDAGSRGERNHRYWLCRCECGRELAIRAYTLLDNKSRGCNQCCHSSHSNLGMVKSWYISSILGKAASRGLDVQVTNKDMENLYQSQQQRCALTGLPIVFSDHQKDGKQQTASLDRIDSSQGYVEGNVQWIHKDINRMKNSYDQDYFIKMCKFVAGACEV